MTDLVIATPHLPAVPEDVVPSSRFRADDVSPSARAKRLTDRLVAKVKPTPWERIAILGYQHSPLKAVEVIQPDSECATFFGETKIATHRLSRQSQLIFIRLHELLGQVSEVVGGDLAARGLDDFPGIFAFCRRYLEWDAMVDLMLADRLVDNVVAKRIAGSLRLPVDPAAVPGVDELRARVVYLIESLDVIYEAALRLQVATRLSDKHVVIPGYDGIISWFRTYAETLEALRVKPPPPSQKGVFRRFFNS